MLLVSANGQYFAIMQPDGNFVLYYGSDPSNQGPAYWMSNTARGQGQYFAIMQSDGNFVLYQGSDPSHQGTLAWNTATISGVITVHNQGAYVASATVEWDLLGQHQSQSSGNFTAGQTYSVPTPIGASNIHVKCEEETGLVTNPWQTIIDTTYPGPAKLRTLKTFKLTGTTLDPTYGENAIIELAPPHNGKSSWLSAGEYLVVNDYLVSANGQFFAIMQSDGNFVLYHGSGPGDQGPAYWASNTAQRQGQFFAIMQNDGNFVLYHGSDPAHRGAFVWNSGTTQGQCFAVLQDDANFVIYQGSDPTHGGAFVWNTGVVNGQITVKNQGGYVARCSVNYTFGGQQQQQSSGNFNLGQSYSVTIPAGASNIEVKCEDETGLAWDPWKTIIDTTYATPPQKTITLSGTTLNPSASGQ